MIRTAVAWLLRARTPDGGWGEDGAPTGPAQPRDARAPSTAIADRLGAAGADGGRRGRSSGGERGIA